jgi:type II secretory pathway pseudopilin PulG
MLAVMAVVASVTVPLAATPARFAAAHAARSFALVLRQAQAQAQAESCRVRVVLSAAGDGYSVQRITPEDVTTKASGTFGDARCTTNYPGGALDFAAAGWPLAMGTSSPRAGSFTFAPGAHAVVVQLAGRIRCR